MAEKDPKQVAPKSKSVLLKKMLHWTATIVVIFGVVFGVRLVLGMFLSNDVVSGDSMNPTLANNDRLVSVKNRAVRRNDIIVLNSPTEKGRKYIKRVIGLPGDTVAFKDDRLIINGKAVDEPYIDSDFIQKELAAYQRRVGRVGDSMKFTDDFDIETLKATHSAKVPKNQYFVLGDNRLVSYDSRYFGFVKEESVESVVVWRYWPLNKLGDVD